MTDPEHRLEALETQLAFQEDAITELSDVLVAQQARIDRLEARVDQLIEQLRGQQEIDGPPEPAPPHY